jgi:hypothetical protein
MPIDGRSVESADNIEQWHNTQAEKVLQFHNNAFGKLKGRNWAIASITVVYQKNKEGLEIPVDLTTDIFSDEHEIEQFNVGLGECKESDDIETCIRKGWERSKGASALIPEGERMEKLKTYVDMYYKSLQPPHPEDELNIRSSSAGSPTEEFALSEIYAIPHIFGSGISTNMPEPGNEDQRVKKTALDSILTDCSLLFSDTGRHLSDFIHEIEPFIMSYIPVFVTERRTAGQIRSAFSAWSRVTGDKNLCRNWFTDSEQVILSYVRRHINRIFDEHLRPSIKGKPLFIILNIVTLRDMCGICFRSVYIQSKMKMEVEGFELPLVSFVTGVLPYHESRNGLTLSDTSINLPSTLSEGVLVVRNR